MKSGKNDYKLGEEGSGEDIIFIQIYKKSFWLKVYIILYTECMYVHCMPT